MESVFVMPGQEFKELVQDLKDAATALHSRTKKDEKKFVSNEEFMRMMGISKRTAQTWRDQGLIAFSQIGGKIYYQSTDIEILMQSHRREQFCLTKINKK